MSSYDDIINLPHHVSESRPQMSLHDRAAQFAPFAALTGFDDEILETARVTDEKIDIGDELALILSRRLEILVNNPDAEAVFTFFVADEKKTGGRYVVKTGKLKKADSFEGLITLTDGMVIPMADLYSIDSSLFPDDV